MALKVKTGYHGTIKDPEKGQDKILERFVKWLWLSHQKSLSSMDFMKKMPETTLVTDSNW